MQEKNRKTKKSPLYTRTGDHGSTSLVGGTRVPKTHTRIEAYGTVDELSSTLGLLATYVEETREHAFLQRVQNTLFVIGAYLATAASPSSGGATSVLPPEEVERMEEEIDHVDSQLPPLHAFVLPGGGRAAAVCHVCRTVCRRAERRILALDAESPLAPEVTAYVNRLSDYLFALARKLNLMDKKDEIFWQKP